MREVIVVYEIKQTPAQLYLFLNRLHSVRWYNAYQENTEYVSTLKSASTVNCSQMCKPQTGAE